MNRQLVFVGLLCCLSACARQAPSAPAPPPSPTSPGPGSTNQAPEIVATFTPASGIDQLTTFTVRVEVRDPDNDAVALTAWAPCRSLNDTPLELIGGVAVLSFVSDWKCTGFTFTAVDARGASARVSAVPDHRGLDGPFKIVIGEDFYGEPAFRTTLTQARTAVTGTIFNVDRSGTTDPAAPGTIDGEGRFRVRFKLQSDEDLVLAGRLVAPRGGLLTDNVVGVGEVIGGRYAGRTFRLWHQASY